MTCRLPPTQMLWSYLLQKFRLPKRCSHGPCMRLDLSRLFYAESVIWGVYVMTSMQRLMLESEMRQRQALDDLRLSLLKELDSRSRIAKSGPDNRLDQQSHSSRQASDLIWSSRISPWIFTSMAGQIQLTLLSCKSRCAKPMSKDYCKQGLLYVSIVCQKIAFSSAKPMLADL